MLDRLPAWARHAILLCGVAPLVALLGVPLSEVLSARGIDGIDWPATMATAVNAAAVSLATGVGAWVASYVTPLTSQYGVGAPSAGEPDLDREV